MHKLGCDLKKVQYREGASGLQERVLLHLEKDRSFVLFCIPFFFFDTHAIIHVNVNQIEEYILRNGDDT